MNCCDITAGMLRERVTIQRVARVGDGYGGWTETWSNEATDVAASMMPSRGQERFESLRLVPLTPYRMITRFVGDAYGAPYYTPADRVFWQNRYFGIVSVIDIESANRWLEFALVEGELS